ncbi:MAG: hypothetical protein AAFQ07_06215 [Chloroflexota bacterium]
MVNNTFIKVLKPRRNPEKSIGKYDAGYFGKSISYREFAQLVQPFEIAIEVETTEQAKALQHWFAGINYLGKRGGFMQIQSVPDIDDTPPIGAIKVDGVLETFALDGVMTQLDDTGADTDWERFNVYSGKRITIGKERLLYHVALPYQLVSSSRGYSYYERIPHDSD